MSGKKPSKSDLVDNWRIKSTPSIVDSSKENPTPSQVDLSKNLSNQYTSSRADQSKNWRKPATSSQAYSEKPIASDKLSVSNQNRYWGQRGLPSFLYKPLTPLHPLNFKLDPPFPSRVVNLPSFDQPLKPYYVCHREFRTSVIGLFDGCSSSHRAYGFNEVSGKISNGTANFVVFCGGTEEFVKHLFLIAKRKYIPYVFLEKTAFEAMAGNKMMCCVFDDPLCYSEPGFSRTFWLAMKKQFDEENMRAGNRADSSGLVKSEDLRNIGPADAVGDLDEDKLSVLSFREALDDSVAKVSESEEMGSTQEESKSSQMQW